MSTRETATRWCVRCQVHTGDPDTRLCPVRADDRRRTTREWLARLLTP